ncbi:protein-methionine-sulfoxide reductase heme-binding subunit MsrQ [Actinobacillus arthritidis]|uniref:protein-methionine-sulfoxide reductase heme-binding subunit MsrQ n=1 Tax=Actinobacillus arthritidis TaxID=157339 RepID=UPI002441BFC1|nr:sulfoxide reductase heme-binding subunit YedZ [Actinobacillus arthritidis]WGE88979.1 sulfoxide reductase heme-binding subunit YedZ [Actinobacillus arthritidis]
MLLLLRTIIHLACITPLLWLTTVLLTDNAEVLGADPGKDLIHFLGYTAIIIFCAMFVLGIMLQVLHKNQYQILRRPLGLWAFVWALLHMLSYLVLELGLDFSLFFSEISQRPYLILGVIAFIILLVMSVTSIPFIKQVLGKKWFSVHQFAYIAIVAAIHYYWSVKGITLAPILIGLTVIVIIAWKYLGQKLLMMSK